MTLPPAAIADFASLPGGLEEVVASVTDSTALTAVVAKADAVVHAAAITAGAERERTNARDVVDVNVCGTQTVLDAVAAVGTVDRFAYVSSGAVYGERTFQKERIDKATTPVPVSLYAITKLAGEQLT